jgi:hypothetical protein
MTMDENYKLVKSIAVTLIRGINKDVPLTTELIASMVKKAIKLNPLWATVDADALTRDLETQFNVWIGKSKTLEDQTDHKPWLPQKRGQIQWRYWERYKELLKERWPAASIDRLEEVTDEVLMRLEDPAREGSWDRRGLVVGHVQSGKTANYTGLINKAVDAGYRVIVVLAGVHKSLRSQTQIRLDEGFLGYESVAAVAANQGVKAVGVGRIAPDLRPNTITNRNDDGDFKRTVAERFQINPGLEPLLFVIKKNASVLKNLLEWVEWAAKHRDTETNRPIVRNVPLLVIDDEADHASVDTKVQDFDEDGKPDPDHDPTVINRRIRRLLHCFEKAAYVGYTATPFANIFIHESGKTRDEGEDLFPRSFIINLPAPSDYMGPLRVFGMDAHPEADLEGSEGLPIVRMIGDHVDDPETQKTGWMPPKHNKTHVPRISGEQGLPESLREAMRAFVLACAARRARGQVKVHNSMLIHVTRFTDVQEKVHGQVKAYLDQLLSRLRFGEGENPSPELKKLRDVWEGDFAPTTEKIGGTSVSWKVVATHLWDAASAIQIRRVNGTAPDILDYETHRESGLSVIAIGGDKLARGLTLEGLTVSYFLRAAKMYDTLMQMGRWFGYRPGYVDLCRMYMTDELQEWFRHVTAANEELRQEFDRMAAVGGTPRDYGLRVKSHPALLITSRVKMRNGVELDLSYAGDITETTVFRIDDKALDDNLAALGSLAKVLGSPTESDPERERPGARFDRWKGTRLWNGVAAEPIAAFLSSLLTHERALKVNGKLMAEYVRNAARNGEITSWTVALVGKGDTKAEKAGVYDGLPDLGPVTLIARQSPYPESPGRYAIRRVLNPRDEAIDLDLEAYSAALKKTQEAWSPDAGRTATAATPELPSGPMIRQMRPKSRALLLVYAIDHAKTSPPLKEPLKKPLVGFAVSFPADASKTTVRYRVNNVFWEQEYGASA